MPTRRQFLAASLASLTAPLARAQAPAPPPIIDTHLHLWDLSRFRLPWLRKGTPFARNFSLADYTAATRGLNVVGAVYMEVDVAEEQQVAEADYVLGVCRAGDTVMKAAVISGRPSSPRFAAYLDRWKDNRYLKGLRQVLHAEGTPAGYCLAPAFVRGIRLLGERGLRFDLCMRHAELGDALKLVEACPDTRFILDHCGNPDVKARDRARWQRDVAALGKHRNVLGKVSGLSSPVEGRWPAEALAPIVRHVLDSFGPDRVLFAADWPVCTRVGTLAQWVETVRAIVRDRPAVEQRKLFHDNAVRVYGLR